MNPSASGWIKKLLKDISTQDLSFKLEEQSFYDALKTCGFIYGSNVTIVHKLFEVIDLSNEELCKVNLLLAFYQKHQSNATEEKFVESVIDFYSLINKSKTSIFDNLLGKKKSHALLEDIINKRVHIDDNIFSKNFNYLITNALLYIDVLAYDVFLKEKNISEAYLQKLEAIIETLAIEVFESKKKKSTYDNSLIRLFEASKRYNNFAAFKYDDIIKNSNHPSEKQYIIDIACMTSWSDKVIEPNEQKFLLRLGYDLQIDADIINKSIDDVNTFYEINHNNIALLSSKNLVQNFYDNSSKMVIKLISRNSKRLSKELKESKELVKLISKSTKKDLSKEEQKKMQEQLLDIFKTIPSLAIFMLPGGAILLPLFVKFIPKLLPSAFDDNRIKE
jgi:tellurite resistance protein